MTLAVVDQLVDHAIILEKNVESYQRRAAMDRKHQGLGRPAQRATPKNLRPLSRRDNHPEA